ncbi:MAG: CobD/CbiB family cobalamin biosynthesis protein [Corynebacterium sp.]|nr:CobD/CbiB family cobalamin biosynthesis protein [Corynebacterium sp.]
MGHRRSWADQLRNQWGIPVGVALDAVLADPGGKYHPVAIFGRWASAVEARIYQPTRKAGVSFLILTVTPVVGGTWYLSRQIPQAMLAMSLAISLGGTTLERVALRMATDLVKDPELARQWIPWLCSRDPAALDGPAMARATVESLAENASDAAIASLWWAIFGAPAVVLHRCVNTLDAMVGYHNVRYEQFGWATARLDDCLAYIPARITSSLHCLVAIVRGKAGSLSVLVQQASAHPSPNAGLVEASAALALGVRLGGTTVYPHGMEHRPALGDPAAPPPNVETIGQTIRLERFVRWTTVGLVTLGSVLIHKRWGFKK